MKLLFQKSTSQKLSKISHKTVFTVGLVFLSVLFTGCSNSLPLNAIKKCEYAGEYRILEDKVQICVKSDTGNFFFSEGKDYETALMVGRIYSFYALNADGNLGEYEKLEKTLLAKSPENVDHLVSFWDENGSADSLIRTITWLTDGDSRWDSLLASLTRHEQLRVDFELAIKSDFDKARLIGKEGAENFKEVVWPQLNVYFELIQQKTGLYNLAQAAEILMEVHKE